MTRFKHLIIELRHHIPFSAFGALTGIIVIIMAALLFRPLASETVFHFLHPTHILLSAFVTTSMCRLHKNKIILSSLTGLIGALGICSISDIMLPYIGGKTFGMQIEWHACIVEHPLVAVLSALIGVALGHLKPSTRCPHALHVLISTWASSFYLLAFGVINLALLPLIFLVLFVAVWIPCCASDIVFPLLFTKVYKRRTKSNLKQNLFKIKRGKMIRKGK